MPGAEAGFHDQIVLLVETLMSSGRQGIPNALPVHTRWPKIPSGAPNRGVVIDRNPMSVEHGPMINNRMVPLTVREMHLATSHSAPGVPPARCMELVLLCEGMMDLVFDFLTAFRILFFFGRTATYLLCCARC